MNTALEPGNPAGFHCVAVRAILRNEAGQMLLVRRSARCIHFAGEWEFPGGKAEEGEDAVTALRREVREEVGLELVLDGPAGTTESEIAHRRAVTLYFYAHWTYGEPRLSEEHDAFAWTVADSLVVMPLTKTTRDILAIVPPAEPGTVRADEN